MFIVGQLSFNFYGRVLEREGGMGDWEKNYLGQFVDLFKYFHQKFERILFLEIRRLAPVTPTIRFSTCTYQMRMVLLFYIKYCWTEHAPIAPRNTPIFRLIDFFVSNTLI